MSFPTRCYCGKVISIFKDKYDELVKEYTTEENPDYDDNAKAKALDEIGITKYCCRRMFISYVDEIEENLLMYPPIPEDGRVIPPF